MNLVGIVIKGELESQIENDLDMIGEFPMYQGEILNERAEVKHYFVMVQSRLFERLLDLVNLYVSNSYEKTEQEENKIIEYFIKYSKLMIEVNQDAINRLFNGNEVSSRPIVKLYDKNLLLHLIADAEERNKVNLQSFLISTPNYSDFYGNRLEKEYNKFNQNFLDSVMTFSEATQKWRLGESTLRAMVKSSRLKEERDYRKSGGVWLIRKDSMEKIYGQPAEPGEKI